MPLVAPLLDADGRTAFFLGGQINCSTTIHSCSDILRLLSMSDDADAVDDPYLSSGTTGKPAQASGLNGFFKSLRGKNSEKFSDSPREAGMEQNLINKIERMNFKDQMDAFYTAYSKVCPLRTIPVLEQPVT
jgi:phototropin